MKNRKPDAALLWKQLDDVLVPRLGLNLTERVVYAHLLRHSRLEGRRLLRFSIPCFSRSVRLSDCTTRQAVRSFAAKGALRLLDDLGMKEQSAVSLGDGFPLQTIMGTTD